MTIISLKSGAEGESRRIGLSDGSIFSLKICYLPPVFSDESLYSPGLGEGREISAAEEAGFRFASACLRAEKAALRLIARAEQTMFGLVHKLKRRGHEPACISAVLSRLEELKLVDDRRFARLWLESRLRLTRSPRRIQISLAGRGIDREAIETALKTVLDEDTELALLTRFVEKNRRLRKNDARQLKYHLRSEGFSGPAIQRFFEGG